MNDFTKDELQEIIEMANDIDIGSQAHGLQMHFKIRNKAQSMIDNYCEHNHRQYYEHVPVYECNKCHMVSMI